MAKQTTAFIVEDQFERDSAGLDGTDNKDLTLLVSELEASRLGEKSFKAPPKRNGNNKKKD